MSSYDHEEIVRLYGPWRDRSPADAGALLSDYSGLWWIAGGWAIEAFTGVAREHGDLDISIPRSDAWLLREYLTDHLDVWAADNGTLHPLVSQADDRLPARCGNLWLRRSGADPWEYDVILMDVTSSTWRYKRDQRVSRRREDILWSSEGIRYLRPEIQLLHKAPGLRPKDQEDFMACLPLLDAPARTWLRSALQRAHPYCPWLNELSA